MLAKQNRIVSAADFRLAMRKGRRISTAHVVLYAVRAEGDARFGFIINKAVGKANVRNLVKRRLRDLSAEKLAVTPEGYSVVMRVLPGAGDLTWDELKGEVAPALAKLMK